MTLLRAGERCRRLGDGADVVISVIGSSREDETHKGA
jgi:hypothetical protein